VGVPRLGSGFYAGGAADSVAEGVDDVVGVAGQVDLCDGVATGFADQHVVMLSWCS